MPCYSIYLNTSTTSFSNPAIIDKSNLANVLWRVNFSSLFGKDIDEYKFCRVRFFLTGESFNAAATPTNDWTNYNGYIAVNLPSTFSGSTNIGTPLGLINVQDNPVTGTSVHCIFTNTMSEVGVDINLKALQGITDMRLSLINWVTQQPLATMQEYQSALNFELYN